LPIEWRDWSISQGVDPDAIDGVADRFHDYWLSVSGPKGRSADWSATWRNWCRKAIADETSSDKQKGGGHGRFNQIIERASRADGVDREAGHGGAG